MRERMDSTRALQEHRTDGFHIDTRWFEQCIEHAVAFKLIACDSEFVERLAFRANLARERIAIRMKPRRSKSYQDIAILNARRPDHGRSIDDAHGKAREVILVRIHNAGMFGHLPANERTARHLAAICNTRNDLCYRFALKLPYCDVIKEEERFSTRSQDIVHAHGNQIDADRIVIVRKLC